MNASARARIKRYRASPKGKAMLARQRLRRNKATQATWSKERNLSARSFIDQIKSVPCMDCGGTFDPVCMDFDHRPGEVKLFGIARGAEKLFRRKEGPTMAKLRAEIAKCDIVCANCHRLRTYRQRNHREVCDAGKAKQASSKTTNGSQLEFPIDGGGVGLPN